MNKKKRFKLVIIIAVLAFVSIFSLPIFNTSVQAYEGNSKEVESMLKSIVEKYGEENVIFDDGIVLNENEEISELELSNETSINWKSEDNNIIEITSENIVKALSSGTTFLVGEKDGKYYIKQVYVAPTTMASSDEISNYSRAVERKGNYVVYLDPGHGGYDPGSNGNGIVEKELNLKIALKLRDKLEGMGIVVKMSRDTDKFVSLQDIANGANSAMPDVFVSIHQNSFTSSEANGIETYWYNDKNSDSLASSIQSLLINNTGANNRGVKKEDFYVVKNTIMPSSLVECGFITNPNEASKLKSEDYQNKIVDSIANGTYEFLKSNVTLDPLVATRIFGEDRYETSYKVFNIGWESSEYAILVPGYDYPDALCAAPLANKYNAPIVLSENESLSSQPKLLNLLKSKGVKNVFIVGGTGVIPASMEYELSAQGINSKRLGGIDRYETSVKIAKELGSTTGEIAIASGINFADGVSISPIAAKRNMPILLTDNEYMPSVVYDYISSLNVQKSYIAGLSGAVSDSVASKFPNAERLGGKNRYETNKVIFYRFKNDLDLNNLYIASGLDFPDALSVSALTGRNSGFVVLSNSNYAEPDAKNIMLQVKPYISNVNVLGSNSIINDSVLYDLGISSIR